MTRRFASAWMLVALSPFTIAACNKDKKDGEDAAAEAAVAAVDAAPEAEAPAASASAAADASAPPVVVKVAPKPVRPDPAICVLARNAKARNSPTAGDLEARCRAQGGTP